MSSVQNDARKIFEGLRIIDFSWVGVGPMAAQTFALFSAEVIRVESSKSLDIFRIGGPLAPGDGPDRSAYWANINRDKSFSIFKKTKLHNDKMRYTVIKHVIRYNVWSKRKRNNSL